MIGFVREDGFGSKSFYFSLPTRSSQVLRGQELATEQGREIAKGLDETSARLNGLSDSLSAELTATLSEIAKQVSLVWGHEDFGDETTWFVLFLEAPELPFWF